MSASTADAGTELAFQPRNPESAAEVATAADDIVGDLTGGPHADIPGQGVVDSAAAGISSAAEDVTEAVDDETIESGTGLVADAIDFVSGVTPTELAGEAVAKVGEAIGDRFGGDNAAVAMSSIGRGVGMAGGLAVTTALGASALDAPAALGAITSLDPSAITEVPSMVGELVGTAMSANPVESLTSLDPSAITESPETVGMLAAEAGKDTAVQKSDDLVEHLAETKDVGQEAGGLAADRGSQSL